MKMFSVKTKIVVSDDCMDEFYDNDPQKVCDEIRRVIWDMYDSRSAGMLISSLEVENEI